MKGYRLTIIRGHGFVSGATSKLLSVLLLHTSHPCFLNNYVHITKDQALAFQSLKKNGSHDFEGS